ncbi:Sds3-like [Microdochium nivale]|nr:Sds3-like [Microdochium nivale]
MAAAETAPPLLSILPPQIEPLSDDDGSSPLSDAPPDRDGTPDGLPDHSSIANDDVASPQSSDDDLSDANDTEAETERLYDTPRVPTRQKDVVLNEQAEGRVYERTPSKLRHQDPTHDDDDDDEIDDDLLSDADVSMASSPPAKLPSPSLDLLAEAANQEAESRKRKRSSAAAEIDAEQPFRKRTGSAPVPIAAKENGRPGSGDEEEEDVDPTPQSRSEEQSGEETPGTGPAEGTHERSHASKTRKHTRSGSRRIREQEAAAAAATPVDEHDPPGDNLDGTGPDEEAGATGDDEPMADEADGEAEAAHRNEEELERKKVAYDQLADIEKRFASFREKLFEERMEQLNREEAMLRAEQPTHPEYLAMMECVEARRNERVIIADRTSERTMETVDRWAVARRAQIHSQYFQSVRESRERVLAELGQRWYDIQHERRKNANNVPEFGLRFPQNSQQRIRQAIAYNKEVSILSGIAKYEGMPAAPDMRGASSQELEDDFDAMNVQRSRVRPAQPRLVRPSYADYGGLPFGQGLGPAGEQFLEQTPWANPNHPAHGSLLAQRQHAQETTKPLPATTTPAPKRSSQKPVPMSAGTISNASNHSPAAPTPSNPGSKPAKGVPRNPSTSPEVVRAASLLEQTSARSMRAMSGSARPPPPPKHEPLPAVSGRI